MSEIEKMRDAFERIWSAVCPDCGPQEYDLIADAVEQELEDNAASFDLRWRADMRAIERWQKAHPDQQNVWPDHADLCVWLMEQLSAKKAALTSIHDLFKDGSRVMEHMSAYLETIRGIAEDAIGEDNA